VRVPAVVDVPPGVEGVPASSLPQQLAWADAAIVSGGVIKYEAAVNGVPMLLVAAVAHQREVAESFAATGGGRYLGALEELDPAAVAHEASELLADSAERSRLGAAAASLVDGRGAERAADALIGVRGALSIVAPAVASDGGSS